MNSYNLLVTVAIFMSLFNNKKYFALCCCCVCVQWQILDDTSLPLSSSVPGVTVTHSYHADFTDNDSGGGAASSQLSLLPLTGDDDKVNAAKLSLDWRFYNFLPRGENKFGCLAYTMDRRRAVRYFTIRKSHF